LQKNLQHNLQHNIFLHDLKAKQTYI